MKRVIFCEHTQVYYPIMQGQISCVKKEPLSLEEEVLRDVPVFRNVVEKCILRYISVKLCEKLLIVTLKNNKYKNVCNAPMRQCGVALSHVVIILGYRLPLSTCTDRRKRDR